MSNLVRVRLDNGIEKNVGAGFAAKHGLKVLDEPTSSHGGRPRPETRKGGRQRKPKTTVAKAAAANQQSQAPTEGASTPEEATE